MGCNKSSSKREVYSNGSPLQEIRKISNKQLTYHLKKLEKEEKQSPRSAEGNIKDQRRNK